MRDALAWEDVAALLTALSALITALSALLHALEAKRMTAQHADGPEHPS